MANITLFAQTIRELPKEIIRKIIRRAGTDKYSKGYDTWSQLISMVFCLFSSCDSVRDISNGLKSATGNLNHLGLSRAPSRSTVAYHNANRDSAVFREISYASLRHFGQQGWGTGRKFRFKMPIRYRRVKERPLPDKTAQDVLIDEEIELELPVAREKYGGRLRRIAVWNDEHGYTVELLTNNFTLAASTIAALYKARWMIEIFFRNLKQLLRIKSFIGTSRNAVEIQIWTAMLTMLLLTWLKHRAKYKWGLANLVVSLRLNTFTKIDLEKLLDEPFTPPPCETVLYRGDWHISDLRDVSRHRTSSCVPKFI